METRRHEYVNRQEVTVLVLSNTPNHCSTSPSSSASAGDLDLDLDSCLGEGERAGDTERDLDREGDFLLADALLDRERE